VNGAPAAFTSVTARPEPMPGTTSEPEPGHLAHVVARDDAMRALVEGVAVVTLCGRWLVPSRDPSGVPRCPRCLEIFDRARHLAARA
jgi:hypothetical protein